MARSNQISATTARGHSHGPLAGASVVLSAAFGIALLLFLVVWAAGGDSFMDNNLWFSVTTALVGVSAAIGAFVTALVAMLGGERWRLLWVPLGVFPVFVVFLALGEAFWWE